MVMDKVEDVKMLYRCCIYVDELFFLFCKDCDSLVCLNCLIINYVGYKMGKLFECMEDIFR